MIISIFRRLHQLFGQLSMSFPQIIKIEPLQQHPFLHQFFLMGVLWLPLQQLTYFSKIGSAILDLVKLGAIQLTLILGANSAAKETVSPSIAPFTDAIIL